MNFLKDWPSPPVWLVDLIRTDPLAAGVYHLAFASNMGREDFLLRLVRAQHESRKVIMDELRKAKS